MDISAIIAPTFFLPQVVENNTPRSLDVAGEYCSYYEYMTSIYLADVQSEERSALRLLLLDLKMDVVGEAADWATTLAQAPTSHADMLVIDWELLPNSATAALKKLRKACPAALVIILISHLDARHQAALSAGADTFISKREMPERLAERLLAAAANIGNR
jgi:DNA-binding NarL/FixJ family response regulator